MRFLSLVAAVSAGLALLSTSADGTSVAPALAGPKPYGKTVSNKAEKKTVKHSRASFAQLERSKYVPSGYIVEMEPSSSSKRDTPHAQVHSHLAKRAKKNYKTRYEWNDPNTFVGISVVLDDDSDYAALLSAPGVKRVYKNSLYDIPAYQPVAASKDFVRQSTGKADARHQKRDQPSGAEAGFVDTFSPHVMTGVDKVHAQGFLGKGQTVAVIDTGIDYTHPALGGKPGGKPCFGKGCKVVGGYALVDNNYNGTNTPVAGPDPFANCPGSGHGTHVAGTIAAEDFTLGFTGVAPHANLTSYRVFGCSGSTPDDVIISAMQRAYFDGNDILSLSLGGPGGFSSSPSAVVASRINALGTPVVIANGNDGSYGAYYASSPTVGEGVTSVGSVNNVNLTGYSVDLVPSSLSQKQITILSGQPLTFNGASKTLEVYPVSTSLSVTDDACNPLPDSTPDLSTKIVLVGRGTCPFATKFANIAAKGGMAVLVYNTPAPTSITYVQTDIAGQQAASITRSDGLYIKRQINAGTPVSIDFSTAKLGTLADKSSGGIMSDFSTYTLSYEDKLLPVVSAPGGNILSTWPVALGSYSIISGTSMATPFIAGSYAVYRSAHGGKSSPDVLRSVFASTATPVMNATSNSRFLETLSKQGAGLVNVNSALRQQIIVSPQAIELNDTAHYVGEHTITLTNQGPSTRKYKLTHIPAGTTQSIEDDSIFFNTYPVPLNGHFARVTFSKTDIVVPGNGKATFTATFTQPRGVLVDKIPVYSGFIHLESQGKSYGGVNISYAGVKSDLSAVQVIDNTDELFGVGLPVLVAADGQTFIESDSTSYSLANVAAWPQFVYRFNFGTPFYQIDVVDSMLDFTPTYAETSGSSGSNRHRRFIQRRRATTSTKKSTATTASTEKSSTTHSSTKKSSSTSTKRATSSSTKKNATSTSTKKAAATSASTSSTKVTGDKFSDVPTVGMLAQAFANGRNSATGALEDYSYNDLLIQPTLYLPQNGTTTLTPGTYRLLLRAQRVFTEGVLESDYESYLSHSFTITK